MNTEEVVVKDGKVFLHIVFGANRWEFEKMDEEQKVPNEVEGCLTRVKSSAMWLLKNWKRIHAEDRAMGEAGMTADIARIRESGYSIVGTLSYRRFPGSEDLRKYNAMLRLVKDE